MSATAPAIVTLARFHAETVRAALDVLHPNGGVIEARILNTPRGTVSGYFDDKDRLVKAVAPYDGTASIYVTLNAVSPDLLARSHNRLREGAKVTTKDAEILSRHWLPIDLDAERPAGISSTDAEMAAAIARRDVIVSYLCNEGSYPEMVQANSGNGGHALVPCFFPNTPEITDLFQRALHALASRFDDAQVKIDPAVFNAGRIWKMPGTIACKGDPIPTRPHRRAEITSAPDTPILLTLDQLEWLADQAPVARTYSVLPETRYGELDVLGEFQRRDLYLRALAPPKHAVTCPWQGEHSTDSGLSETCIFEPASHGEPWGFKCMHSHCSERSIKDVLALFRNGAGERDQSHTKTPRRLLTLTPLRDLLNETPEVVQWLLEDRLPAGGVSVVVAKPKVGKSTFARCLALAVARGDRFLECPTACGAVFYLALEEKRDEVRAHFEAMGATDDDQIFVFIAPSPEDGLKQLKDAAEKQRPAFIVVDPLMKLIRVKDADAYAAVTQALEPLMSLARQTGAHILSTHHSPKGDGARDIVDAPLGSTAIAAAVDTVLLLRRKESYRTLASIQRYGTDLDEIVVTLDPVTRMLSAGPSRRDADEAQAASAILDYLQGRPEPAEERDITEGVEGWRKGIKCHALRALVEQQKVTREGAGKRGDPYRYSISSFLVPTYTREPENQKSKNTVNGDEQTTDSRSREKEGFELSVRSREREFEEAEELSL
ncbi:MAG: AAA family ATPase [candidate division NC10 bacterium]|nr:AAA family ATPase [candidate division NC10 bacterium]